MKDIFEYILSKIIDKISAWSWFFLASFGGALLVLRYLPSTLKDWNKPLWSSQSVDYLIAVTGLFFVASVLSLIRDFKKSSEPPRDMIEGLHDMPSELALNVITRLELDNMKDEQEKRAARQFNRGIRHLFGKGVEKNAEKAFIHFEAAAEQGNASAQNNLGFMYANGKGVTQDYEEAVRWYQKATEQGHALAQNNLGFMYANGKGVTQDYEEAMRLWEKAAEQNNALAQHNLGTMYVMGTVVTQDYEKAMRLFKESAEQGDASAQNNLGFMYATGMGVKQDEKEAVHWLTKATEQGESLAQFNLAVVYGSVIQNDEEANHWYQRAVQQVSGATKFTQEEEQKMIKEYQQKGYANYLYLLGVRYAIGNQVTQNHEKAAHWLTQASQQDFIQATRALELLKIVK